MREKKLIQMNVKRERELYDNLGVDIDKGKIICLSDTGYKRH